MSGKDLDAEYGDWQEVAEIAGWSHGELCERWSDMPLDMNCQRPAGHHGAHAVVLGMDQYVNDWVTFESPSVGTTERG